tara:strand:+ start:522 stop:797 length:276 start_codon:yes stop_codon:yes gene_type:complete
MSNIDDLREIVNILERNPTNKKKKFLLNKLNRDLNNLVSKYEYMYDKYIIRNKSIHMLQDGKEKEIAIVQNSIKAFFPYILAYNTALISQA